MKLLDARAVGAIKIKNKNKDFIMRYRKRLSKRANKRRFARGAKRVKEVNLSRPLMRGGYRL